MARIYVIGGTGFIGRCVVRELQSRGERVTVVHHDELAPSEMISDVTYIRADLTHESIDYAADCIMWLVPPIPGLLTTALAAMPPDVPFLYASTLLLYPDSETPCAESVPVSPATDYERSKYAEEEVVMQHRSALTIARLGNVYGDLLNRGFIGIVCEAARDNRGVRIRGDGMQMRDFVYVEDVARALSTLAARVTSGIAVYNICSGHSVTLNAIVEQVRRLSGARLPITYEHGLPEKRSIRGDTTKIRSLGLSFRTIDDGLQKTYPKYTHAL